MLLGATDFFAVVSFTGVAPAGLIDGVDGLIPRCLEAYGSAVAGRTNSGLRGLLTGPAMREFPVLVDADDEATADRDVLADPNAEGVRAFCVVDSDDGARECAEVEAEDFTGEKDD